MAFLVVGIVLLLVAYLLPDIIPVPPGIEHVLYVLGWLGVLVGLILLIFWFFRGRAVGPGAPPAPGAPVTPRRDGRWWLGW